ncbi:cell wall protein DAN4 [Hyalella azteca]|uniref:Cell wall protein DAN4 n=1 Tax=Hyalella azteca TaxID=294128 RepID=A0A8B7P833_HYAAZ|nr:cell wall protein DAN4 [Hyalella azteca]
MELFEVWVKVIIISLFTIGIRGFMTDDDPCAPDCSQGDLFLPHPKNCTKYYQCANGEPVLEECPDDLYFNPKYGVCDHPISAGCTADPNYICGGEISSTLSNPNTVTTTPLNTNFMTTQTTQTTFNLTTSSSTSASETTDEQSTTELSIPSVTTASTTLSTATEETDDTTAELNESSTADSTTWDFDNTTHPLSTIPPTDCVPSCSSNGIIPNPRDCSTFFVCSNGLPVLMNCSDNLLYNPDTEKCDFPENVDCTDDPNAPC